MHHPWLNEYTLSLLLLIVWQQLGTRFLVPFDGVAYLQSGLAYLRLDFDQVALHRTPIYPLFVGVIFRVSGSIRAIALFQLIVFVFSWAKMAVALRILPGPFTLKRFVTFFSFLIFIFFFGGYQNVILQQSLMASLLLIYLSILIKGSTLAFSAAVLVISLCVLAHPIFVLVVTLLPIKVSPVPPASSPFIQVIRHIPFRLVPVLVLIFWSIFAVGVSRSAPVESPTTVSPANPNYSGDPLWISLFEGLAQKVQEPTRFLDETQRNIRNSLGNPIFSTFATWEHLNGSGSPRDSVFSLGPFYWTVSSCDLDPDPVEVSKQDLNLSSAIEATCKRPLLEIPDSLVQEIPDSLVQIIATSFQGVNSGLVIGTLLLIFRRIVRRQFRGSVRILSIVAGIWVTAYSVLVSSEDSVSVNRYSAPITPVLFLLAASLLNDAIAEKFKNGFIAQFHNAKSNGDVT